MEKIRIAQIGTSETTHASQIFRCMLNQSDLFDVVGFADVDMHSGQRDPVFDAKLEMDPEELLNLSYLDAVAIECDEVLQTQFGLMAAERGLPMHFEKPGSESDHDFGILLNLVEQKNLVFHMGYMYRYNPAVQYILETIEAGKLGDVYCVEAQMGCFHTQELRRWLKTFHGGIMYYLGCHLIDLICLIQGTPLDIQALNIATCFDGGDAKDFGLALCRYSHGISFAKTCAIEVGGYQRRQLVVCGTEGTIELKPLEEKSGTDTLVTVMTEHYLNGCEDVVWDKSPKKTILGPYNRYDSMMRSFAAIVRGEKINPFTYEYERQLHKNILKACGLAGV
ncbi:MAG: Gfo/Idh/MocA family protein [Christensenellales bacterium]|jgi:predicted dehydrogenase